MANPLESDGSFDPLSPKIKLRVNQLGVPMDVLDVDNNFEIIRRKLNEIIDEAQKNPAEQNVQVNWEETNVGSDAFILNKPVFAKVANTGNYEDLVNTPSDVILQNSQSIGLAFATLDLVNDRTTAVETSLVELANSAGVSLANSVSLSSGLASDLAGLRAADASLDEKLNNQVSLFSTDIESINNNILLTNLRVQSAEDTVVSLGNTVVSLGNDLFTHNQESDTKFVSLGNSVVSIHSSLDALRAADTAIEASVTALSDSTTTQFNTANGTLSGHTNDISTLNTSVTNLTNELSLTFTYEEGARSGINTGVPNTTDLKYIRKGRHAWVRGQISWEAPIPEIVNDRACLQFEMPTQVFPEAGALGPVSVHAPSSSSLTLGQEPEESAWYVDVGFCKYLPEGGKHYIFVQLPNLNGKFLWKFEFELNFLLDSSIA